MKEYFEKTKHIKNNNKSKKYILRGQRNARYHDRILSNKKKSYNLPEFCQFYRRLLTDTDLKSSAQT